MTRKTKVLVVDDSALVRKYIADIINENPELELIGTASDPYVAVKKMKSEAPDVITMDIEMPKMDGLTFIKRIMAQNPIPIIVVSSLSERGSKVALNALEYGAVDVIQKPELRIKEFIENYKHEFYNKINAAQKARITRKVFKESSNKTNGTTKHTNATTYKTTDKVIAIGASTGGTEALKDILEKCDGHTSGIVIVQHMPEIFTKQFADRLNSICKLTVKEAQPGDTVTNGKALIAPGNKHMVLKRTGAKYTVDIIDGEPVNRHKPSVDVLFESVAKHAGSSSYGVLLTGMGNDGAKGLLKLKNTGAKTFAQDEASSVVFGMPQEAIKLNAASQVYSLDKIGDVVSKL